MLNLFIFPLRRETKEEAEQGKKQSKREESRLKSYCVVLIMLTMYGKLLTIRQLDCNHLARD